MLFNLFMLLICIIMLGISLKTHIDERKGKPINKFIHATVPVLAAVMFAITLIDYLK